MKPRALLLAALVLGAGGCQVGSIRAFGGDWPIPPPARSIPPWRERGGGPQGVVVSLGHGEHRVLTSRGAEDLEVEGALDGAQPCGPWLYRVVGDEVRRERFDGDDLRVLARIEGARDLAVLPGRDPERAQEHLVVVSGDGAVHALREGQGARSVWEGDALAVALDPAGTTVWIAARAPLPVIDCVDLESGEVRLRMPLPIELESASLSFVVGPRAVALYAHDRPLASALIIAPAAGVALPLRPRGQEAGVAPGSCDPYATPVVIVPPGLPASPGSERLSLGGPSGDSFGRLALLPDGTFLMAEGGVSGVRLARVSVPTPGATAVAVQELTPPEGWSGRVEAVGWDPDGAVLASGRDVLTVRRSGDLDLRSNVGRGAGRVALNHALTTLVFVFESATALTVNMAVSVVAVPLSPFGFFSGEPALGVAMLTAPVWAPVAFTFRLGPF